MSFDLESVVKANSEWKPLKMVDYSVHGLGKTTFAATCKDPILIRVEDNAGGIDVPTFPNVVETFADMENTITALHGEHSYQTAIVDTLDWLEPIVWQKQIKEMPLNDKGAKVENIEDYGYGKGYNLVLDWWRHLMQGFDSLRFNKGMDIILLAHAEIKRFEPPDSDPYDQFRMKLHKHASALWQEWANIVMFCNFETSIEKTSAGFGKEKTRGTGNGARVIYTEERPAFKAKSHFKLPPKIFIGQDENWSMFHSELNKATNGRYELPTNLKETEVVENA